MIPANKGGVTGAISPWLFVVSNPVGPNQTGCRSRPSPKFDGRRSMPGPAMRRGNGLPRTALARAAASNAAVGFMVVMHQRSGA